MPDHLMPGFRYTSFNLTAAHAPGSEQCITIKLKGDLLTLDIAFIYSTTQVDSLI